MTDTEKFKEIKHIILNFWENPYFKKFLEKENINFSLNEIEYFNDNFFKLSINSLRNIYKVVKEEKND